MCDACCHEKIVWSDIFEKIKTPTNLTKFMETDKEESMKPANTDCRFMQGIKDATQSGCAIHSEAPFDCDAYHCGMDSTSNRRQLLGYCLHSGLINETEYEQRTRKLML